MRSFTENKKIRLNIFGKFLLSVAIVAIATNLIVVFFAKQLIVFEKNFIKILYSLMLIYTVDTGWNSLIVYRPSYNIITIVLNEQCIGIYSIIVYILFIVLTPMINWRSKIRGLTIGVPVLFLANATRIMASGFIGVLFGVRMFKFFHDYIGGGLMIFMVAILWTDWVYRTMRYGKW